MTVKIYDVILEAHDIQYVTDQPTWFGVVATGEVDKITSAGLGFKDTTEKRYTIGSAHLVGELRAISFLGHDLEDILENDDVVIICGDWRY